VMLSFSGKAYVFFSTCGVVFGAYPSTYPFENESFVPVEVPASTPDFSFNADTDPGGYIYRGNIAMEIFGGTLTDDDIPYCNHSNQYSMWLMVMVYGTPPVLPFQTWNCTTSGLTFVDSDFTGIVNNEKICNVGSCCTAMMGLPKFGSDQMTWHSWADDRAAANLCDVPQTEALYCVLVGGHYQANCYEYYPGPSDRIYMQVCFDNIIHYWLTCTVFKSAYAFSYVAGSQDTPIYQAKLSPEESMSFDAVFTLADRLCHPYSYFFPETLQGQSASSAATSSTSSDTSSESSAKFHNFLMAVGTFIAMF